MTEFPLPLPFGGVSDDLSFGRQDLSTSREIRNMRPEDPENGRRRISYRAGQSRACAFQIEAGVPVAEIISAVYDGRNVTYSHVAGQETEEWAKGIPSKADALGGVTDSDGNLYVLDGPTSVVKFNPSGEIIWQFPLPSVDGASFLARFIFVDDLFDVYVGLSSGNRQAKGKLWKLTQLPDAKVEVAWEVALTSYVETGVVRQDKLYTIQNEPDTKSAFVRVYSALDAAAPILAQEWRVAYPANDIDVDAAGNVFVASEEVQFTISTGPFTALTKQAMEAQRPTPATFSFFGPFGEEWTPRQLDNADQRIWSWFEADDIGPFDVQGAYVDGARIRRWPDRSGHNRHLYAPLLPGKGPTLAFNACLHHKGVRFNGVDEFLTSLGNSSTTKAFADQQRTVLPAYEGSMFCTIAVIRPEMGSSGLTMHVFGQGDTTASDHILWANRSDGSATPGTFSAGTICHFSPTDAADPGRGSNQHPKEGTFDIPLNGFSGLGTDVSIITILWDGGIDPGASTAKTRSLFQYNGHPVDRYLGKPTKTLKPTLVGKWTNPSSGVDLFKGDFLAWITLDRKDRSNDTAEPKILTHDALEDTDADVDQTDNELTRLVGYLAHRFGVQWTLPDEGGAAFFKHPYGMTNAGVLSFGDRAGPPLAGRLGATARTQRAWALLAKYSPQGALVWTFNWEDALDPDHALKLRSGMGFGVRCAPSGGGIFTIGAANVSNGAAAASSTRFVRKIIDKGTTYSLAAVDGAWSASIDSPTYHYPRMAVDAEGNLYVPTTDTDNALLVYKGTDGTLLSAVSIGTPARKAFAVALDPKIPDYRTDLSTKIARFVYVMSEASSDQLSIHKIRLVQQTPLAGSPRRLVNLAISRQGAIRTFELGGAVATPTGAGGALSSSPVFVQATSLFGKVYITDGVGDVAVFDPILNTVTPLVSTTPGEPPHGCKILEAWNGRLVGARSPNLIDGAFNWIMSARGKPTEWDTSPVEQRSAAAIGGSNAEGPGLAPDIVNTFIPYNDDLGIWGCDHSIYRMTGDPGEGGTFDLVVGSVMGMAIGRPWCKGPNGSLWFVGAQGGLFFWSPGGFPERVSLKNIEQRLRGIDFSTHTVRLVWNDADQGLHIFRIPLGAPGDPTEHYFWSARNGGTAWPDTFEATVEPTACYVVDGDEPEDRVLLLGGRDGFIRKWDPAAGDDDGFAIERSVLVGPLANSEASREHRFIGPRVVLASDLDGCEYELFATDDPAVIGPPRHSGSLVAGRNPMMRTKMRGSYCYIRFFNRQVGQRFAIEEVGMVARPAGRKRVRGA